MLVLCRVESGKTLQANIEEFHLKSPMFVHFFNRLMVLSVGQLSTIGLFK
jgi:hypothetical protein